MKISLTTTLYTYILAAALAVFIHGCAADHDSYRHQTNTSPIPQIRTQASPPMTSKPVITAPAKPYREASVPNNSPYNYSSPVLSGPYSHYNAVRNFIRHMVQKHGFSENYLNGLFSQANRLEYVIRLETPSPSHTPSRPGSWSRYRGKFLTDAHIKNGADFWRQNATAIQKASSRYGVDPEYIVAIIGVETYFGRNIGKTSIFDSLTTLSFDTHRRSKFFTAELENFLLMTREEGYDPLQPVGSWAGAMGLGQFMPSSFRRLAVDFNNDGRRDIWQEHDAIGSVANYFSHSGWQYKNPVAKPAGKSNDTMVIELSTYEGNEYWRVYPNFKVIKRYNNSNKYAMAVHQLAQAIKQRISGSGQIIGSNSPM